MTKYRYRAAHATGKILKGNMTAMNEKDLSANLRHAGLELIDAKAHADNALSTPKPWSRRRIRARQRALACRQIKNLLMAGVPFIDTLSGVSKTLPYGPLRDKLEAIGHSVNQGTGIAAAFAEHPDAFNKIFLAILNAGEKGGDLAATFGYLADFLDRQTQLHERLRRAIRYPLFLLALATSVMLFMLTMVVPRVMAFLHTLETSQPMATRLFLDLSLFVTEYGVFFLILACSGAFLFVILRRVSMDFAQRSDELTLRIPFIGSVLRQIALARYAHSLALLLKSGGDIPSSLVTARTVLANRFLETEAKKAASLVQTGQPFSSATKNLFPPSVIQMLAIGEQSGTLNKTLEDVAQNFDEESRHALDQFIGTLEPTLTLLVGAMLAWVVLAVLGPVYGSLSHLSATGAL